MKNTARWNSVDAFQLFLLGFLGLFLELTLIRYLAGNVWNLGYFPNLVLLAAFLGMGIGFLFHQRLSEAQSEDTFLGVCVGLALLVVFVSLRHPAMPGFGVGVGDVGGEVFFTSAPIQGRWGEWAAFLFWFLLVVAIFACVAQRTAKIFRCFSPLTAYTLDIGGSCCGILAFMAVSYFELSSCVWFLLAAPFYWGSMSPSSSRKRVIAVFLLIGTALVVREQDQRPLFNPAYTKGDFQVVWSPYQKVEYVNDPRSRLSLYVNGLGHQRMHSARILRNAFYGAPYRDRAARPEAPPYRDVLVLGSGCGNDVAAALLFNVRHVDAVEIDPVIARLGAEYHPARPYSDPRVHLTVDDGRAFMMRTDRRYDLIIFALTDSLVKVSGLSQLRLENYLFTEESIRKAYSLLSENGEIVFYNYYRFPWLTEKLRLSLYRATGKHPRLLEHSQDFTAFSVGGSQSPTVTPVDLPKIDTPTDDWPFFYLKEKGLPRVYLGAMVVVAALVGLLMVALKFQEKKAKGRSGLPQKAAFCLMGAAFLLLETKTIVQFSLLFGTTWLNTSLSFLAVLLLVLAANVTAAYVRHRWLLSATFILLLASCLLTLFYPLSHLLAVENPMARYILASFMTFTPIYFANVIFSVSFRDQKAPEHLFGWNLIGAVLGGTAEYLSMAIGYNALAVLVAALYVIVCICLWIDREGMASLR